jgi:uncharacterized protein YceK
MGGADPPQYLSFPCVKVRPRHQPLGAQFMRIALALAAALTLSGCATIVNDPNIPLAFTFSDGSAGQCNFRNKRGAWSTPIPATGVLIRRSDDALVAELVSHG